MKRFLFAATLFVALFTLAYAVRAMQQMRYSVLPGAYSADNRPIWTCKNDNGAVVCAPDNAIRVMFAPPSDQAVAGKRYQQYDFVGADTCMADYGHGSMPEPQQPGHCIVDHLEYAHKWAELADDGSETGTVIFGGGTVKRLIVSPAPDGVISDGDGPFDDSGPDEF